MYEFVQSYGYCRASSTMLPIQSTLETMDFSAKFNEWTMQGVQNTCGYLASTIMPTPLQIVCIICNDLYTRINTYIFNNFNKQLTHIFCILVLFKCIHYFQENWTIQGRHYEVDEWVSCWIYPYIRNNANPRCWP